MPGGGAIGASAPTDQMAIWSLVSAIAGLVGLCCAGIGGLVLGPLAFFLGNSSLKRIRASGGSLGGDTLANIGRVVGIIVGILGLVILLGVIVNFTNGGYFGR